MSLSKIEKSIVDTSIYIYLTLVIMNSVNFIRPVVVIGSIGKLLFCFIFIAGVLLFVSPSKFKIKFLSRQEWIISINLLLFFATIFFLSTNIRVKLLPNIAFPFYFLFYYLIVKLLIRVHYSTYKENLNEFIQYRILYIFRKTLYLNFIFWFIIALASSANLFEVGGGFGGFFQDEIHFGFYVVTGFLISFYFRFNSVKKDLSYLNLLLMSLYGFIALFTSRNALLIIIVTLFYYFVISKIKNNFLKVSITTISFFGLGILYLSQDISQEEIIKFTSGRYQIWLFAFEKIFDKGFFFFGSGILNLNDIILNEHKGIGFYYLDSLPSMSFHNSYVELLAGGGIIVVVLFFKLINKTWKLLSTVNKSIIIGILIGATFESFLIQPFMLISALLYFIIISQNTVISYATDKNK